MINQTRPLAFAFLFWANFDLLSLSCPIPEMKKLSYIISKDQGQTTTLCSSLPNDLAVLQTDNLQTIVQHVFSTAKVNKVNIARIYLPHLRSLSTLEAMRSISIFPVLQGLSPC